MARIHTVIPDSQKADWDDVHRLSFKEHGLNPSAWRRAVIQQFCDEWRKEHQPDKK